MKTLDSILATIGIVLVSSFLSTAKADEVNYTQYWVERCSTAMTVPICEAYLRGAHDGLVMQGEASGQRVKFCLPPSFNTPQLRTVFLEEMAKVTPQNRPALSTMPMSFALLATMTNRFPCR